MKNALLALTLCVVLGSCKGLGQWADAPADPANPAGPTQGEGVVEDVGGVLSAIPGAGPYVLLAGAVASIFFASRKKKQPTP